MRRYPSARVFALACVVGSDADRDGLPNVLLEAMACGVPVVSTRVAAIPEAVEDGVNGLLVPPADPEALAEALVRMIRDPELAAALGARARASLEERFELRRCTQPLARLLEA